MATESPKELQEGLKQMKEWISKQPQLPQNLKDQFIVRFLHSCYYVLENTKKAMELFFTLRASFQEVIKNRDPLSTEVQKAIKIYNFARLHLDGNNFWIWQLNDPGLEQYQQFLDIKLFVLNIDSWLLVDKRLEEQDIIILDVKDVTLKYITKMNLSLTRKYLKYLQEAVPIRLMQVHIINAPKFFDRIYSVFKPLLKKELRKKIYLHASNSQTIFDHISKEKIPRDFGGTLGTMQEHMKDVLSSIMSRRDDLLKENLWTSCNEIHTKTGDQDEEFSDLRNLVLD